MWLVAANISLAQTIELTTNGDFEAGDTRGFTSFPSPNSSFLLTTDSASGSFAGEIINNAIGTAAVIQQLNIGVGVVTPGELITVMFDARGDGVAGGAIC